MIASRIGAYIEELAVDRASRGQGIGRALVEAVERWAREFGGQLVMLGTGTRNTAAQAFYDRIGYRQIGVVLIRELDEEPSAR